MPDCGIPDDGMEDGHMLRLTHAAATEVAQARQARGLPESFGLRIFGEPQPGGAIDLGLAFAEVPAEDDQVTEQEGTRLFLAPEVVEPLATAALDVQDTPDGTTLVLTEQEPGQEG
jgi:Fe-S cluster assembly iron-binding protein IscA